MTVDITNSMLMEKAIDYAKLSQLAYANWENGVPVNVWGDSTDYQSLWSAMKLKGYTFIAQYRDPITGDSNDSSTGYSGVIFQDKYGTEILANRGTSPSDPLDLMACKELALGETPAEQFTSMVKFITDKGLTSGLFDVTGHSLGGCLAQMAAAAYTVGDVYTYNAPGAKNLTKN